MTHLITAVLRHPVAMAIKRRVRDLHWTWRRDVVENPQLPQQVRSILFVCLGNICRSPFASELAAHRLAAMGNTTIASRSAGIRTTQAGRSPAEACEAAAAYGIQLGAHVPHQLTQQLMDDADLIVVMEARQFSELRSTYPMHRDRIFLLALLDPDAAGAHARYNIVDPFGRPIEAFHSCYRRISRAVDRLVSALLTQGA